MIPILDAGHGGMINGVYTTAPRKKYTFTQDGYTVYEGVINRAIGKRIIDWLKDFNYPYYDLTVNTDNDIPLSIRTREANNLDSKNKYLISIHCNSCSENSKGPGKTAHGNEIWLSKKAGKTSKIIAEIAAEEYRITFPDVRFRGIKYANHWITTRTTMPAILVDNRFFDNREEAEYLMSEQGQFNIARCLFKTIQRIYNL